MKEKLEAILIVPPPTWRDSFWGWLRSCFLTDCVMGLPGAEQKTI